MLQGVRAKNENFASARNSTGDFVQSNITSTRYSGKKIIKCKQILCGLIKCPIPREMTTGLRNPWKNLLPLKLPVFLKWCRVRLDYPIKGILRKKIPIPICSSVSLDYCPDALLLTY